MHKAKKVLKTKIQNMLHFPFYRSFNEDLYLKFDFICAKDILDWKRRNHRQFFALIPQNKQNKLRLHRYTWTLIISNLKVLFFCLIGHVIIEFIIPTKKYLILNLICISLTHQFLMGFHVFKNAWNVNGSLETVQLE